MSVPHHHSGTANDMSDYLAGTANNTSRMIGNVSSTGARMNNPYSGNHNQRNYQEFDDELPQSSHYSPYGPDALSDYENHLARHNSGYGGSRSMFSAGDYDHSQGIAHSGSSMYPSYYNSRGGDMSCTASAMPRDTMSTADLFGGGSNSYYAPTSSNFHETTRHARMQEADRLMTCAKVKSSFPQPIYGAAAKTASAYGEYWE